MTAFEIFVQKIFLTNRNFRYQRIKAQKKRAKGKVSKVDKQKHTARPDQTGLGKIF